MKEQEFKWLGSNFEFFHMQQKKTEKNLNHVHPNCISSLVQR